MHTPGTRMHLCCALGLTSLPSSVSFLEMETLIADGYLEHLEVKFVIVYLHKVYAVGAVQLDRSISKYVLVILFQSVSYKHLNCKSSFVLGFGGRELMAGRCFSGVFRGGENADPCMMSE